MTGKETQTAASWPGRKKRYPLRTIPVAVPRHRPAPGLLTVMVALASGRHLSPQNVSSYCLTFLLTTRSR